MIDLFEIRQQRLSPYPSFADFIDASGDCWQWTGAKADGYGRLRHNGRTVRAHRFIWENLVGVIPEGFDLDHLCRNRACVNPDHLEPVTRQENLRRGFNARSNKTHCPQGHEYVGDNIMWRKDGGRGCWACSRANDLRRKRLREQR